METLTATALALVASGWAAYPAPICQGATSIELISSPHIAEKLIGDRPVPTSSYIRWDSGKHHYALMEINEEARTACLTVFMPADEKLAD